VNLINSLRSEFEHEARTTRRHLERLPSDRLSWRPHEKSFTAIALASHIVDCVRWADLIFSRDEVDINPVTFRPYRAESVADLLKAFDDDVAICTRVLAEVDDPSLMQTWRLKMLGRQLVERSRASVFRDFTMSHMIHHRGQLSVYLRLLDVAVPGAYGPSADEQNEPGS
jgi:uncharacterized damage-inducible protein DinB